MPPPFLELPALAGSPHIRHGFFTRQGGVSTGVYASLNCGVGADDDRQAVAANRGLAMAALGFAPTALLMPYQVHSARVLTVASGWPAGEAPQADALVTDRPGICLGALSADCVPILFADAAACVIGAAHAGWKGALHGVLEATVEAMTALGATTTRIAAGIGPAIRQCSYEVGPEFPERFQADAFFTPSSRAGHFMFDLPGYVAMRLRRMGLAAVEDTGLDTLGDETRLFSYRRGMLNGEQRYGRMLSAIGLT